jgi:release factor glutamine methyltransferase
VAERPGSRLSIVGSRQDVAGLVEQIAKRLTMLENPLREARELVAALLDVPRHWPLLHENRWVDNEVWLRAMAAAARRARGAPLAYAVRRANFRDLTLDVDERVLIPRPETEQLVDLVLESAPRGIAVDVGTGSGAIAISLATEGRFAGVIGTDISRDALEVARGNAARCGATIDFRHTSLLSSVPATSTSDHGLAAVVSNPPYISLDEAADLPASVRDWEPPVALYSNRQGLALTAQLVRQAAARLAPGGLLALEVDARRASLVAELVSTNSRYDGVRLILDLAGRERFVLATRRSTNG